MTDSGNPPHEFTRPYRTDPETFRKGFRTTRADCRPAPDSHRRGCVQNLTPFVIRAPQATLDDLRVRLSRTRWADEIDDGWTFGTNRKELIALVDHWTHRFDWREQEQAMNRFAHFRADVNGFGVHFIHERGKGDQPIPIVLTHGYPDSFLRFAKIIPLLADPESYGGNRSDAFDVIVPSLPGFGFSDKPTKPG